jgi:hypothetical protein
MAPSRRLLCRIIDAGARPTGSARGALGIDDGDRGHVCDVSNLGTALSAAARRLPADHTHPPSGHRQQAAQHHRARLPPTASTAPSLPGTANATSSPWEPAMFDQDLALPRVGELPDML